MFKLPLKLAFKYFKSNKGGIFSFTSFLAVTGLSIGVASLIIVMSVMNGFEKELQNRILGVVPHAVLFSEEPIKDYEVLSLNSIGIITGPESGFSAAERDTMSVLGLQSLKIGHYVLRAETAPVVGLSKFHSLFGEY